MWLILICVMAPYGGCDRADGVELARVAEWRVDARLVDEHGQAATWHSPDSPPSSPEAVSGINPDARFRTRADCMRTMRRALRNQPYFNDHGDHFTDAILTPHWNYPRFWGCFQEAPLVG